MPRHSKGDWLNEQSLPALSKWDILQVGTDDDISKRRLFVYGIKPLESSHINHHLSIVITHLAALHNPSHLLRAREIVDLFPLC